MKLRAKVSRTNDYRTRSFKAVFPVGVFPHIYESILQRNLGSRPYSEISMINKEGEKVRIWIK